MHTPRKSIPGSRQAGPAVWPRHQVGWLIAFMFATSATFIALRVVTPSDGTQVLSRPGAWTGDGVIIHTNPGQTLRDRDLVTAIDAVALGSAGRNWHVRAYQPGDRLTYQVVRGGDTQKVTITLRRADTGRLRQAWGTILFVVVLFCLVAYLYARRAGPATTALLVLGSGLLSSTVAVEIGVSAVDTRGGQLQPPPGRLRRAHAKDAGHRDRGPAAAPRPPVRHPGRLGAAQPGHLRQGGGATELIPGEIWWPPVGKSHGHHRGGFMTVPGEISMALDTGSSSRVAGVRTRPDPAALAEVQGVQARRPGFLRTCGDRSCPPRSVRN
jgi:hypothetical protein